MSVVQIKQFKNKKDQPVAGLTPERAVYDENGVRLNDKLKNLNIENITQAATSGVTAVNTAKTTALNEISSAKSSSLSAIRAQEAESVAAVSAQGESYQEQIDGLVDKIELYNLDVISGLTGGNHYSLSGNGQTYILTVESSATATGVIGVVINGTTVNTTVNKNATVNQVASALAATSYTSVGFKARAVGAVVYLERTTGGINPATVSVNVASTGVDMEVADGPVGTISALGIISGIMPADARIPGKFICFNNYESDMETWQYIGGTVTSPSSWKQEGSNAIAKIIDGGVAFTEEDGQVAGSAQFDPEADTVHKAAQYLSPSEKAQVLANLGITGIDAEPTSGSTNLVMSGGVEKKFTDLLSGEYSDDVPTAGSNGLVKSGGIKIELDKKVDGRQDSKTFYVTDDNGNIIAKVDKDGVHSVDFKIGEESESVANALGNISTQISDAVNTEKLLREQGDATITGLVREEENRAKSVEATKLDAVLSDNAFYFTDANGYIIAKIDANGVHSVNIDEEPNKIDSDSITVEDSNGYIIARIDKDGIHSAKDKRAVACMVLSESYYPTAAPVRDGEGNVTYAEVMFETGVAGSLSITYTNGNSSSIAVVYGDYNYTITINRDVEGNVETVNIQ